MTIPDPLSVFAADLPENARWTALAGGRTNRVWRVQNAGDDLVCKLYRGRDDNPLFANDPKAEFACLTALDGQAIAPAPVRILKGEAGTVLLYRYLDGAVWREAVQPVARLLRRVHELPPPSGLRQAAVGAVAVLAQADAILAGIPVDAARLLQARRPVVEAVFPSALSFLHGDVVLANLLQTPDGLRLIDWQCPALGDPVDDLACFLSPAMQVVYGSGPLTAEQAAVFLDAYDDAAVVARYRLLAPACHYRMAAYCLWRVARGNTDYRAAFEAEVAALG
jgi:thiamine kinase